MYRPWENRRLQSQELLGTITLAAVETMNKKSGREGGRESHAVALRRVSVVNVGQQSLRFIR